MDKHPLYDGRGMSTGGGGEDDPISGRIPQVYLDIATLITDILVHRYVGVSEAEQLFDAIACGLEACDVPKYDAELIRAQLWDSTGRDDG